ncbi:hypothetical protein CICLE_v10008002mg [Citrus x clementina]|uniref:PLD phosphodiesterase domain-containing protein n=1 Tax=Citrus clementina TaxID=85681 RepID=V4UH37_CITCL|nr:phospholipase D Z isoform X2 [Citrus x clementina]ESR63520.1 hypothetical protein CICLE_v10008002mg [Citrus x clementina]
MKPRYRTSLSLVIFILFTLYLPDITTSSSSSRTKCKAWLVQSIPTDMPHLPRVPGIVSSGNVLKWLAGNSTKRLDIIAQYWQLIARPNNSRSGDYGYSEDDMKRFGAQEGFDVYKSIENAADRNVRVRLLQHLGVYPDFTTEASNLASGRKNVENVTLLLGDWWGSGIVHAKVWISDCRDVYIGSANNDWKSLTQVKEVGIYLVGCPTIAKKVEVYFENLWTLSSLNSSTYTRTVSDQQWQANRTVPCWSHFLDPKGRCRSPLPPVLEVPHVEGYPILSDPYMFRETMETPGSNYSTLQPHYSYLSFAPPEVVFSKHANVKILVAYWAHFINNTDEYLKSLLYSNVLCNSSKYNKCSGKVEIKYYKVPGYNLTGPAIQNGSNTGNIYPGFTRVNHGKYAVSDSRAHIGTSNLVWDYFYTTAGVSFGTYNPAIVSQLQEIFDADWNSPYAFPVEELGDGHAHASSI